jgi:hypothetical protein
VSPDNNAAIPLLQALTAGETDMPGHYAKVWAKLGVPMPAPANAQGDGKLLQDFGQTLTGPWTADKSPAVAEYLTANQATLDLMVRASRRDHYYMPLVREQPSDPLASVLLPQLNRMRHWTNALKARAMLRLGKEETDAYCDDVIAIVRLGRLSTHAPTLVENLVGVGCEATGLQAIRVAATGGWLSEAQAEKLLKELRSAPARRRMSDAFEGGERGVLLEFLQTAAVHGVAEAQKMLGALGLRNNVTLPPVDPMAKDWNAALRKANGWYDRLEQAGKQPTYTKRMRATAAVLQDLEQLRFKVEGWKGAFAPLEDRLVVLVMPSMTRAYTVETRVAVEAQLTELAIALSAFRSKTGEFPPELRLLVPTYFKELPPDGFTDKPLDYHQQGNGYILSSPGPDGVEGGEKSDDLIVEVNK